MCGIAGFLGSFEPALLDRMQGRIAHRGPDDHGLFHDAATGVGLAHRRLSIIDLSPLGHQPMWDSERRAAIVYNGELYNYRELRRELIEAGFVFRSHSDTEVLLNLYLRDGEAMLEKLNGIFAFALWDAGRRRLFVARDGFGIKPLYWTETPQGFLFASEIKALLEEPTVGRDLDAFAVRAHLAYLWSPAPHTILKSVRKLEPGHALSVEGGRIAKRWRWYDLPYDQPVEALSAGEAAGQVREAIRVAVERQMVADVPVGAFLSGGLDSSSVVAFAKRAAPDGRLPCFTIGFEGDAFRAAEGSDEDLPYARRVAEHLGVDLHVITVGPEMIERFDEMIYHLDEPQGDPAPLNVLFISELARQSGIKVLLSGAGGDDIFTGYRRHVAYAQERLWRWLPAPARRAVRRGADAIAPSSPLVRRVAKAFRYADRDDARRLASYFFWIDPDEIDAIAGPLLADDRTPIDGPLLEAAARLPAGTPDLNRMLYLESKFFLADHNLNYTDKMSMATGVEVRVPLLDPDLVALAARLPPGLKQRGATGKWIFKKAMEPLLPRETIYRTKTGFGAPVRRWLRHELAGAVEELLAPSAVVRRGLFDPAAVRRLIEADRAGRLDAAYTIFTMMSVETWCRLFLDGGARRFGRAAAGAGRDA